MHRSIANEAARRRGAIAASYHFAERRSHVNDRFLTHVPRLSRDIGIVFPGQEDRNHAALGLGITGFDFLSTCEGTTCLFVLLAATRCKATMGKGSKDIPFGKTIADEGV